MEEGNYLLKNILKYFSYEKIVQLSCFKFSNLLRKYFK
jgi:hypothetical protein